MMHMHFFIMPEFETVCCVRPFVRREYIQKVLGMVVL